MIPLTATTETLQIVVSANADVTVMGYQDGVSPPTFKQVLAATTGAARTICDAIANVANPKNVSHVTVKTTGGTNIVTLQSFNSSGLVTTVLVQAVLAANETLEYTHGSGFKTLDASCQEKFVMPGYLPLTGGTVSGATTLSAALTYGGVTLTNAVTGTGKMVLDTSPTIATPVINSAAHVGGIWVADATWTLPAVTLGGAVTVPTGVTISGAGTAAISGFASVSATSLVGTLSTAAQPNITSVGTLTSLTVSGAINAGGNNITGGSFFGTSAVFSSFLTAVGDITHPAFTATQDGTAQNRYISMIDSAAGGKHWGLYNRIGGVAGSVGLYNVTDGITGLSITAAGAVSTNGGSFTADTVSTTDPAGGAGPMWKLGVATIVSPTAPNRTVRIDIAGTSYYLAAKTTND